MNAASWILALGPFLGMTLDGAAQEAEAERQERAITRKDLSRAPRVLGEILRPEAQERDRSSRIDELREARLRRARTRLGILRQREAEEAPERGELTPGAPLPRAERAGRLRGILEERLRQREKDALSLRMRIRRAVMDGRAAGSALRSRLGARDQQVPNRGGARSSGPARRSNQARGQQSQRGTRRGSSASPRGGNRGGNRASGARPGRAQRGNRQGSAGRGGSRGGRRR